MDRKYRIGIFLLLISHSAFPQPDTDSIFLTSAKQNSIAHYQKALGAQARLYNGSKYKEPDLTFEEHPYFASDDWIVGTVFYDGEWFSDIPLMYDLLNDVLVTEHYPSGHAIQLVREKLQNFVLNGHYFEKIHNDSVNNSLPETGFYDVLYSGETKVVAARKKQLRERVESLEVFISYDEKNRFFMLRNGIYFAVKNKASVLRLMDDKRQELTKFLKQKNISFSDNRESALKSIAEYYDSLK